MSEPRTIEPSVDPPLTETPSERDAASTQLEHTEAALEPVEHVAPRTLWRSRTERLFGGVCGGIGRNLGVDPTLVRGTFALLSLVGGAGVLAYSLALVIVPLEEGAGEPAAPVVDLEVWVGLLLTALGGIVAANVGFLQFSLLSLGPGSIWPAAVGLGALSVALHKQANGKLSTDGLRRPRHDRLISGLLSGFARYANLDTNAVRIAFLVVTFLSRGLGALLYLVLTAFVPEDRD